VPDKSARIVAQYVREVFARAHLRPYENRQPVANGIDGSLRFEALPEAGHWRVELELGVKAVNTDQVLCFEAGCHVEAIAFVQGLEAHEIEPVLTHTIASLLMGNVRAAISSVSQSTGYGPVTLPPLSPEQLASLVKTTPST
jgi:preprotein translocase subunit SecB